MSFYRHIELSYMDTMISASKVTENNINLVGFSQRNKMS